MKIYESGAFSDKLLSEVDINNVKVGKETIIINAETIKIELTHKEASKLVQPIKQKPLIAMKILNGKF